MSRTKRPNSRVNQDRLDSSKLGEYAVAFPHKDRILTIIDSEVY